MIRMDFGQPDSGSNVLPFVHCQNLLRLELHYGIAAPAA